MRGLKRWFAKRLQEMNRWLFDLAREWMQDITTWLEDLETKWSEELQRWGRS